MNQHYHSYTPFETINMKHFLILTLAAAASAARLEKVYLPPHSGSSGGVGAGLQAPAAPGQYQQLQQGQYQNYDEQNEYSAQIQQQSQQNQAQILRYENEMTQDGYHYAYETSDGTKVEQEGRVLPGEKPEEGTLQVSGSYSYVGDDGQTYTVTYTADENGFQPQGAHLPTPPPIPEAILRSLQLTAGNGAHYDSGKNSYDADNGY